MNAYSTCCRPAKTVSRHQRFATGAARVSLRHGNGAAIPAAGVTPAMALAPQKERMMIAQSDQDTTSILRLSGYMDADTAPLICRHIDLLRSMGHRRFVVDCSAVTYMSSHGVWTLLRHALELQQQGGDLRLAGSTESVCMVLRELKLESHISQHPTTEDAVRSFES